MKRVLVVLPTYQEADNIVTTLRRIRLAVPEADVLVVDDASPDGTAALAKAEGCELGRVDVLSRPSKLGIGGAYRLGFQAGLERRYDVLVEMDSDMSHDPASLPSLLTAVEDGADLAIGSRYVAGGAIPNWPLHRRLLSSWGNRYAAALLGLPIADATAGFRAYRAETLARLGLESIRAEGYGFQIEMAYRVVRAGGVVVERPIEFVDRRWGTSKMSSRIVVEAMALVTWWGLRDRLVGGHQRRKLVRSPKVGPHTAATGPLSHPRNAP